MKSISHAAFAAFAVISLFALPGCSSSPDGASEEQITNALAVELDPGLEVEDLEVKATESLGTEVDPRFRTRSTVTIAYEENFYRRTGEIDGRPLVTKVADAGDTVSGDLITVSTLKGDDNWRVQIERVEFPSIEGQAASQFGNSQFVVEGSEEHQALSAQVAEAEAKAEAERVQKIADLSAQLAGTWVSSRPMIRDGAVYEHRGLQTGYELALNSAEGTVGTGTAKMYVFSRPTDSVSTEVGYVIDESGDFATVTFNSGAYHRQLRTDAGRRMQWQLTPDGQMRAESGRNVWVSQLSKQ